MVHNFCCGKSNSSITERGITSHLCGLVGTAGYGIQFYSLAGCCTYQKITIFTHVLDPVPASELHRSHLLYFVGHKAWYGVLCSHSVESPKRVALFAGIYFVEVCWYVDSWVCRLRNYVKN